MARHPLPPPKAPVGAALGGTLGGGREAQSASPLPQFPGSSRRTAWCSVEGAHCTASGSVVWCDTRCSLPWNRAAVDGDRRRSASVGSYEHELGIWERGDMSRGRGAGEEAAPVGTGALTSLVRYTAQSSQPLERDSLKRPPSGRRSDGGSYTPGPGSCAGRPVVSSQLQPAAASSRSSSSSHLLGKVLDPL